MDLGLKGRVALVAGASQGLGKAVALSLAQEGARVALCSRDLERAARAAKDIRSKTRMETFAHAVDVSSKEACEDWVKKVAQKWGRIDILVCNAGGPQPGTFDEIEDASWEEGFSKNFMSAVWLSRSVIPWMKRRKWGRIIFIASTSAKQPIPGLIVSNALRAGILGLSKTLSQELGPYNILVNVVCPGYTTTERLESLARHMAEKKKMSAGQVYKQWAKSVPLERLGEPREIASAVTYLASEEASYITGIVLQVDGGRVAGIF